MRSLGIAFISTLGLGVGACGSSTPSAAMSVAASGTSAPSGVSGSGAVGIPAGSASVAGTSAGTAVVSVAGTGQAGGTAAVGGGAGQPQAGVGAMTAASSCKAPQPNATPGNACPGSAPPMLKLTQLATGLESPTYVTQAPGDATRLYVLEQRGTVRIVKDGQLLPEPLIDLRDLTGAPVNNATIVSTYGEGGLLGAAFDPRFADTQRFWLSYTKPGPAFTVAQFTMTNPDRLDVTQYKELLTFPQYGFFPSGQSTNHVGSMLAFGPDGCMYVSRGDGGGENDRQMSGQDTGDDLCSILRIDVDTYPTPVAGNLEGHVWNFGLRNPWRHSFDRETGDLYIGDVGQDVNTGFEEINIEPRGVVGRNYGWSVAQGSSLCKGDCSKMTKPAHEYGITDTQNSVIGGYVYRGEKIPALKGRYVWADWTERKIKTLVYKGETGGQPEICDEYDTNILVDTKVRSFGEGSDGEIYVVAGGAPGGGLSSAGLTEPGTLYRIDAM